MDVGPIDQPHKPLWQRTWLRVVASLFLATLLAIGFAAQYIAHNAEPLLRKSVVETLQQRFHTPVELASISISAVRGLQVRGEGLRILREDPTLPPLVAVQSFTFHTTLDDLLHLRSHVDTIHVEGLELHIPPHSFHLTARQPAEKRPAIKLTWDHIDCQNALLVIETDKPNKQPLQFVIHNLALTNTGAGQPFLYQADLVNPRPQGDIHAFGHFGPWQAQQPRSTNLDGDYRFDHADLSTIKGIGGILTSAGHFAGQLNYLTVDGTTDTPAFTIDISHHPVPLHTTFHAFVDGTTGDTTLAPVQAHLGNSFFTAQGTVMHIHTTPGGHDIALTISMPRGRAEDLLALGMKTQPPLLRGALTMQAHLHIPPGHEPIAEKLQLAGSLNITNVEFNNPHLQDRVDGLSMRAQGHPDEVKLAASDHRAEVDSQLTTNFTLSNAMLTLSDLHYDIPGAQLKLDGVYSLDGNIFSFGGRVHTEASASQMVTGWKSMLLKPLDGFLGTKGGSGLDLPIAIDGVKGDYAISFHETRQTADQMAAQMAAHAHPNKSAPR